MLLAWCAAYMLLDTCADHFFAFLLNMFLAGGCEAN
jgi:hypothetical protein